MRNRREILLSAMYREKKVLKGDIESWGEHFKANPYSALRFSEDLFIKAAAKEALEWTIATLNCYNLEQAIVQATDHLRSEERKNFPDNAGHDIEKLMNKYYCKELRSIIEWMEKK